MPGFMPGIDVLMDVNRKDVDGRDKRAFTPVFDGLCPAMTSVVCARAYAALAGGTGSAVTDLIFSMAKREVTFFRGTALISFL